MIGLTQVDSFKGYQFRKVFGSAYETLFVCFPATIIEKVKTVFLPIRYMGRHQQSPHGQFRAHDSTYLIEKLDIPNDVI